MRKITNISYSINLFLVDKYDFYNYLFVFGWVGFIKYRFNKTIKMSVNVNKLKLQGARKLFFTYLNLIYNFYTWTSNISKKNIILKGVGFKFRIYKNTLYLVIGYSHIIKFKFYYNMKINLVNNKLLSIYSIDLIGLNNCIYRIKKIKKLDVYKGKGVLLQGEKIIKKEGKKATFLWVFKFIIYYK